MARPSTDVSGVLESNSDCVALDGGADFELDRSESLIDSGGEDVIPNPYPGRGDIGDIPGEGGGRRFPCRSCWCRKGVEWVLRVRGVGLLGGRSMLPSRCSACTTLIHRCRQMSSDSLGPGSWNSSSMRGDFIPVLTGLCMLLAVPDETRKRTSPAVLGRAYSFAIAPN